MNEEIKLPQLPPVPSHPSSHTYRWSEREHEVIRDYGQTCAALGFDAARPVADAGEAVGLVAIQAYSEGDERESGHWFDIHASSERDYREEGYKIRRLYDCAAPSARTLSEAQAANLDLVIARLEQIASNSTDDYRNSAAEALACARAIAATSAPAEAPSDAWAGSVQQVICDLPLPQGSEKERQRLVDAKALILAAIRALQGKPEAPKGGDPC